MSDKHICFRFDIDTHVCLSKGLPNLLALAKEEGVSFTFFINMGKGFDRLNSVKNIFGRFSDNRFGDSKETGPAENLSMFGKLGRKESLVAMLLNPLVGSKYVSVLKAAVEGGHELGLHGGRNHSCWEKEALTWSSQRLGAEVAYGVNQMIHLGLPRPTSFASPAWQSPDALQSILQEMQFTVCADWRDADSESFQVKSGVTQVPTNILSPADDVGYIENFRARGADDQAILSHFKAQLAAKNTFAMVYEHPFYAGVHELDVLRGMIRCAKAADFTPATLASILR